MSPNLAASFWLPYLPSTDAIGTLHDAHRAVDPIILWARYVVALALRSQGSGALHALRYRFVGIIYLRDAYGELWLEVHWVGGFASLVSALSIAYRL